MPLVDVNQSDSPASMPPVKEQGGRFNRIWEPNGWDDFFLLCCFSMYGAPLMLPWCYYKSIHGRNACISGLEWKGSLLIYNKGEPAPPGFRVTCCCGVLCCKWPALAGIPEGTPRVPQHEEREILARWQGHFKIDKHPPLPEDRYYLVRSVCSCEFCCGRRPFNFTDAWVEDDLLAYSGGKFWVSASDKNPGFYMDNSPQHQKLSLWRSGDGVLYCDNVGATVEESESELKITTALGQDLVLRRVVPDARGEVVEGEAVAAVGPNEVVVEGEVAAEEPMDRG